jgi:transcriptional regulator with GAF, ATPase, and Fis domain
MQRFGTLLADVWREASRHIEIQEFVTTVSHRLHRQVPLGGVIIRRLDVQGAALTTVASTPPLHDPAEHRSVLSPDALARVCRWCRSLRTLRRGSRLTGTLGLILPPGISQDVLAVPLIGDGQPTGTLLLTARSQQTFEQQHQEVIEALREPFSVALENDRRLEELARLRQSAEADRGALLRRLGRTDVTDSVVGEDTGLRLVMERVRLVADSDVPVLILGETGTGKELVARAIHTRSHRAQGPFIRVNCGAIPRELIDSQLFGHEKGSFTGADRSRAGWFERAHGGTLLLDEIGELPLEAQVRLLRVLQDGYVERVGGSEAAHVDVRVVAATHRDLAAMVRDATFREDLWYRLAVFPILLPPLRERREDIGPMVQHLAERAALRFGLASVDPTREDIDLLSSYDWPGNIRELGAVIDRAVILGEGRELQVAKALGLQADAHAPRRAGPAGQSGDADPQGPAVLSLDQAMRAHIEKVLRRTEGRIEGRRGAAALLKINPHTLRARMRKLGIRWADFRPLD